MSLIQDLGARLRATSDELPLGLVTVAVDRLRAAADLLLWVRQASVNPVGVPRLGNATEHAEQAAYALRVAQDALASYLALIGIAGGGAEPATAYSGTADKDDHDVMPPPAEDATDADDGAANGLTSLLRARLRVGPDSDDPDIDGPDSPGPDALGPRREQRPDA